MPLPERLYLARQTRELDRLAIEDYGIPGYTLMSRAGEQTFYRLRRLWPDAVRIAVVCGPGNNGGDGFVIARAASKAGLRVVVALVGEKAKVKGDAATALAEMERQGVALQSFSAAMCQYADVVVDALFGTGLDRPVKGQAFDVIQSINHQDKPVLAVDIPSGLHADTGAVLGTCITARATVSFIGLKQGLFTGQGPAMTGSVYFHDLGVPEQVYRHVLPAAERLNFTALKQRLLPRRSATAHKGDYGHVLVVGGYAGMAGAPALAGLAAYRAGAGLVSLATHPDHAALLNVRYPELMVHGVGNEEAFTKLAEKATVIVLGPGLGRSAWSDMVFNAAIALKQTQVVDADALNALADNPTYCDHWIMTPHPGEAGRLLGLSTAEVQTDRFRSCEAIVEKYGGVVVLKGAGSLVFTPASGMYVSSYGNPGMATGGSGDCLSGVLGALLAQGLNPVDAAALGVSLHGLAGDRAATAGQRGMMAADLLDPIRGLIDE